jgi:hypothetical protein
MARHDRHGTFADQRDRHRVGAHAVADGAAGGVGGVEAGWMRDPHEPALG